MKSVDPLTLLLRLPLMPIQGLVRIAQVIAEQAEQELRDPARVRRELEEAQEQRSAGVISDEDLSRVEYDVTTRYLGAGRGPSTAPDDDRS